MRVEAVTKHPSAKREGYDKKYFVDDLAGIDRLPEVLARADIVSIHTPLTDETRDMFGEKEFSMMKKSAYLINVARARIVNKDALFAALSAQRIAGAAFDVFWREPPDPEDKMLSLENFILTPHIAGWTSEAIETITQNNFDKYREGVTRRCSSYCRQQGIIDLSKHERSTRMCLLQSV